MAGTSVKYEHISIFDIVAHIFFYSRQLNVLVHERHEAFARLKTAEDLLEALRAENEMLHRSMSVSQTSGGARQPGEHTGR